MTHSDIPVQPDAKVLAILRLMGREPDKGIPLTEMARRAHASPASVRIRVGRLKKQGYRFKTMPNKHLFLVGRPDVLTAEEVLSGLATRRMGRPLHSFRRVTSTNDVALEMARHGAPEGTVVVAEIQTRGRGRLGRVWAGTPGLGLAFSVILRPRLPSDEFPLLTLAAAVAVAQTLEGTGLRPEIKWPNDVMLSGKKVCGILTEMQAEQDRLSFVVVGIGVNVNQSREDLPEGLRSIATSLLMDQGRPTPRARFLQTLLQNLEEVYDWVKRREGARVLTEWRRWSSVLGRQVRVTQVDRTFFAQALHVDEKGALWVRNDVGMVERLTAGDLQILRLTTRPPGARGSGRMGRKTKGKK